MTKEEMKALVSSKIEGQGNQVDAGGALATVLNEIIDGMGGGGGGEEPVILDLGEIVSAVPTNVTTLVPDGYYPKTTDKIKVVVKDFEDEDFTVVLSGGVIEDYPIEDYPDGNYIKWFMVFEDFRVRFEWGSAGYTFVILPNEQ